MIRAVVLLGFSLNQATSFQGKYFTFFRNMKYLIQVNFFKRNTEVYIKLKGKHVPKTAIKNKRFYNVAFKSPPKKCIAKSELKKETK